MGANRVILARQKTAGNLVPLVAFAVMTVTASSAENISSESSQPPAPKTATEQLQKFLSSPKTAIHFKAIIRAPETVRVKGTNVQQEATHAVQGTRHIQCYWMPTLVAYSEDFLLPGWRTQRTDVIRDGDSFISRTVSGSTNEFSAAGGTIAWDGPWSLPIDRQNPVAAAYKRASKYFQTILNFGIAEADIGSVRWNEDHFAADGYALTQPLRFDGTLAVSDTGEPSRLEYKRTVSTGILRYRIQYHKPTLVVSGTESLALPSGFDVFERNQTNALAQEISIHEIALVSQERVRQEIDRLTFLANRMTNQYVVQGGQLYARLKDGMLVPYWKVTTAAPFRLSQTAGRTIYWLTTVVLTISFFLFLWRGASKETNR